MANAGCAGSIQKQRRTTMVARKSSGKKGSRVKVGKLKLTKATVKDLTKTEAKKIKGGSAGSGSCVSKKAAEAVMESGRSRVRVR
jgi:hypothetical protein